MGNNTKAPPGRRTPRRPPLGLRHLIGVTYLVLTSSYIALADVASEPESLVEELTYNPLRSIIAGGLLVASLSLAGIWLARSPLTGRRSLIAALIVITAVLMAAAIVLLKE
ncbi:MAG TPA: hypothetical protein VMM84_15405 [Pyrinomonadaceae bacterium]|nr:hypothetical protein [Pyrinomonadaceae bacterium]